MALTLVDAALAPQATLAGQVTLGRYEPPGAMKVMVFPSDRSVWLDPLPAQARFLSRFLNADASFSIDRIPPGDYLVVVVAQSEIDLSVAILERWAERATPVTLRAGSTTTVALKR